jgi:hypothetical protein
MIKIDEFSFFYNSEIFRFIVKGHVYLPGNLGVYLAIQQFYSIIQIACIPYFNYGHKTRGH